MLSAARVWSQQNGHSVPPHLGSVVVLFHFVFHKWQSTFQDNWNEATQGNEQEVHDWIQGCPVYALHDPSYTHARLCEEQH